MISIWGLNLFLFKYENNLLKLIKIKNLLILMNNYI